MELHLHSSILFHDFVLNLGHGQFYLPFRSEVCRSHPHCCLFEAAKLLFIGSCIVARKIPLCKRLFSLSVVADKEFK